MDHGNLKIWYLKNPINEGKSVLKQKKPLNDNKHVTFFCRVHWTVYTTIGKIISRCFSQAVGAGPKSAAAFIIRKKNT